MTAEQFYKELSGCDATPNSGVVKLYYPSRDMDNKPLDQAISNPLYKQIIKDVSQLSGGVTIYPVQGYYINHLGQLIQDDISLITIYTSKLTEIVNLMRQNAMLILKSLNQESVLLEIDNRLEFITSEF